MKNAIFVGLIALAGLSTRGLAQPAEERWSTDYECFSVSAGAAEDVKYSVKVQSHWRGIQKRLVIWREVPGETVGRVRAVVPSGSVATEVRLTSRDATFVLDQLSGRSSLPPHYAATIRDRDLTKNRKVGLSCVEPKSS